VAGLNVSIGGGLIVARSYLPDPVPLTSPRLTLTRYGANTSSSSTVAGRVSVESVAPILVSSVSSVSSVGRWLGVVVECAECHSIRGRRLANCVCIIWGWQIVT
jgi:hypothetical protein